MKAHTVKCYCAESYDLTKKTSIYFNTFGNENDLDRQKKQILKLQQKRNEYYRNSIPTKKIDNDILNFKKEVAEMKNLKKKL